MNWLALQSALGKLGSSISFTFSWVLFKEDLSITSFLSSFNSASFLGVLSNHAEDLSSSVRVFPTHYSLSYCLLLARILLVCPTSFVPFPSNYSTLHHRYTFAFV